MRKPLIAGWFLLGASMTLVSGTRSVSDQRPAPEAVTVKYIETHYGESDGSAGAESVKVLAIRSDGSRVEPRTVTAPDGKLYEQKIIVDVAKRKRIVVDGITRLISTTALRDREVAELREPGAVCSGSGWEPGETIHGYRTMRREIPLGTMTLQEWRAPDLGCVKVRQTLSQPGPGGTSRLVLRREATEFIFGEPDDALFEAPDWPEAPPSQVFEAYRKKFNLPDTEELRKTKEGKDRAYWALQQ